MLIHERPHVVKPLRVAFITILVIPRKKFYPIKIISK